MTTLSLRLPASLHERLRELAAREGISINQLITLAAAEKVASILTVDYLAERARAADLAAFDRRLARVPDAPVPAGDEWAKSARDQTAGAAEEIHEKRSRYRVKKPARRPAAKAAKPGKRR